MMVIFFDGEILSFVTNSRFAPVSSSEMREMFGDRYRTFTNIRFDGLHPDITLVGPMGGRRVGLLGSYHSKIVLYAYHKSLSWTDCMRLFDYKTYDRIGYFDLFRLSSDLLLDRDQHCDIKFASKFLDMTRHRPTLYTVNHPTGGVFHSLSRRLCEAIGTTHLQFGSDYSINDLSNDHIWPVYDEIAEYHRLRYRTPQYFSGIQSFSSRTYSMEEFVRRNLEIYRVNDDGTFRSLIEREPFFKPLEEKIPI